MKKIIIIGRGIAGLAAAYRIQRKISEGAKLELPELLIEREVENIISRRNEMIEKMKVTKEDYFRFASKTEEQMDEEAKVDAEERLKRSWVLTKLGELENTIVLG